MKKPFAMFVVVVCLMGLAAVRGRAADAPPAGAMPIVKIAELEVQPTFEKKGLVVEDCGPYFVLLKSPTASQDPRIVFFFEMRPEMIVKEVMPRSRVRTKSVELDRPTVESDRSADGIALVRVNIGKADLALAPCLPAPSTAE